MAATTTSTVTATATTILSSPKARLNAAQLPDEVLVHMYTYLNLTDLASCAVLTRSWRDLVDAPFLFSLFRR
jgi:hypothetical protein